MDDFDKDELQSIAAYVGLMKEEDESWMQFAHRIQQAYDEPVLQMQYKTTILRLRRIMQNL